MTRTEWIEQLGQGFHAGFRKASDHPVAFEIWKKIKALPDAEYVQVVEFVVDGLKLGAGSDLFIEGEPEPPDTESH